MQNDTSWESLKDKEGFIRNRENVDDFIEGADDAFSNDEEKRKYYESLTKGRSPLIEAIKWVESGGEPYAVGPRRRVGKRNVDPLATGDFNKANIYDHAIGPVQVMAGTAKDPGFGLKGMSEYERYDPEKNIEFGEKYINALLKEFNNNTEHALMAYNWGPGITKEWIKQGSPSSDKIFRDAKGRNRTTGLKNARNYVNKVISRLPASSDSLEKLPRPKPNIPPKKIKLPRPKPDFALLYPDVTTIQKDLETTSKIKQDVNANTSSDVANIEYTILKDDDPFLGLTPDTDTLEAEQAIYEEIPSLPYRGGYKHSLEDWAENRDKNTKLMVKYMKETGAGSLSPYTMNNIDTLEAEEAVYEESVTPEYDLRTLSTLIAHPDEYGAQETRMGRAQIRALEKQQILEQEGIDPDKEAQDLRIRQKSSLSPRFISGKAETKIQDGILPANAEGQAMVAQAIDKGSKVTSEKEPIPGSLEEKIFDEAKQIAVDMGLTSLLIARQGGVSVSELLSLVGQAGQLAFKYGNILSSVSGLSQSSHNDHTIWKDLWHKWHENKHAALISWDHYVKQHEQGEHIFSKADIGQALGKGKKSFQDVYHYLKLTKEEETPFLRIVKFGFDLAAPAGLLGATVRGGNLVFRNAQRAQILSDIAKKTGDKLPFASLAAFRDISFKGDNVSFGTLKYLKDSGRLEEWKKKGYTTDEAEAIMKSNATNFRIAVGGMAGMGFGEAIASSFDTKFFDTDVGGYLPLVFGLAGSLGHGMITKPFSSFNPIISWPVGIIGTLALWGTNPKIMFKRWEKKGIDPEDFAKMSILGAKGTGKNLYLQMMGWSFSDVKNMKKIAIKNGNEAKLELDDIQQIHGVDSSIYRERKKQLISNGTLNEDLTINKWSVMVSQANVSREHADFLKRFKANLDEMGNDPRLANDVNNLKAAFTGGMGKLEELQSKFPNELGSFELILSQALQSSVLQNMMSVLASKATASAKKGKWFTRQTDLFELNRMNNITDRNILAIQRVMTGLTDRIKNIDKYKLEAQKKLKEIEETKGIDSIEYKDQKIELEKLDGDGLTSMQKIVGRMRNVLSSQKEALSEQVNIARDILSLKIQPNWGLNTEERKKVAIGLGIISAKGTNDDLVRNAEITTTFTKVHDDVKKTNDENWAALKDKNKGKLYDSSGIAVTLTDDLHVLKDPLLESLAQKIAKGSMEKSIKSKGDNLLEGLDLYKTNTLDGIESALTTQEKIKYETITKDLNNALKKFNSGTMPVKDAEGIAQTLIDKLSKIKSIANNASVVRHISFDDYKKIRQHLSTKAEKFRASDSYDDSWRISNKIDELDNYMKDAGVNVEDYEKVREFYKTNLRPFYDKKGFLREIHQSRKFGTGEEIGVVSPRKSLSKFILNDDSSGSKAIFDRFFMKTDDLGNKYYDENTFKLMAKAIGDNYNLDPKNSQELYNLKNFLQKFEGNFKVIDDQGKIVDSGYAETFTLLEKNLKQFDTHTEATQQSFVIAKEYIAKTINEVFETGKSGIDNTIIKIIAQDRTIDSDKFLKIILGETDDVVGTTISMTQKEYDRILSDIQKKYLTDAEIKFPNNASKIKEYVSSMTEDVRESLEKALNVSKYDEEKLVFDPAIFMLNEVRRTSTPQQIKDFEDSLKQVFQKKFENIMFPLTENVATIDLSLKNTFWNTLKDRLNKFLASSKEGKDHLSDDYVEQFIKDVEKGDKEATAILEKIGMDKKDILGLPQFKLQPDLDLPATRQFLSNNKVFIKELFGEDRYKLYEDIFELGVLARGKFTKAGSALSAVQWEYTMPMFLGRVHAIARGVLSPRYLAMEAGVTHWRHTRFLLMREILQDKKFAESLHSMMLNPNPTETTLAYFTFKMAKLNSIAHLKTLDSLGIERTQGHTVLEGGEKENKAIVNQTSVATSLKQQFINVNQEQRKSEFGYALQAQERRAEELYGKDWHTKGVYTRHPELKQRRIEKLFNKVEGPKKSLPPKSSSERLQRIQNLFGKPNYDALK